MTGADANHRSMAIGEPEDSGVRGLREPAPRWTRLLVGVCLAAALLLVGAAAGGLLFARPGDATVVPDPGSIDVGFAQDMSVHHDNAVQMATWARERSSDPAVRQLAYDIESGQTAQIGQMQGWLALWNAPTRSTGGYMRWMPDVMAGMGMGHPSDGLATMPGMATSEDLSRLRRGTGAAGDVLFLQLMLRHHEGGADMLRYAGDNARLPQVRNLAAQMLTAQTAESQVIRQMLAARGAAPLAG